MRPLVVLSLVLVAVAAFVIAFFLVGGSGSGGGGAAEPTADQPVAQPETRDEPLTAQPAEPTRIEAPRDTEPGFDEAEEEQTTFSNVVFGFVINDRNEPVEGAKVKLSRDALSGDQMANQWFIGKEPSGAPPHVATSKKDGRYEFKGLPPAKDYFLLVEHPDYAHAQEESIVISRQGESRGPDVVLRAGSRLIGHVYDVENNVVPKARLDLDSAYMMGLEMASPDRLTTYTDASGYFEFNNVATGPRNLTCTAEGYGVQIEHNVVFKGDGAETLEKEFRLQAGHPIGGRVFGPENEPIPGVKLTALNYGSNKSSRGVAVSGDDGSFLIEGLEAGSYILLLEAKGYRQSRQNRVQTDDLNVQIEMLRQATLSGRVLGTNGPVDDFTVSLNRVTPSPQGKKGGVPVYEPTSVKQRFQGARGNFTLEGVDPGTFALKVSAPGYAPRMSDTFVVVQDQPPQGVTVTLSQGGSIRGRVVDSGGRPVAMAQVVSRDDEQGNAQLDEFMDTLITTRTTERKARSNDDGFFELKLLNPGQYRLVIEHPNFATETVRGVIVTEGAQADAGAIGLRAGGTVRGKVLDRAGKPLPRAWAKLYSDTGTLYQTRTDNEGRYVLEHIVPGSYKLSATRSGSTPSDAFGEIVDQQNSQVQLQIDDGQVINRDLNLGN
jgi:protocatechuate 3,4-dioxygenase beta subunit